MRALNALNALNAFTPFRAMRRLQACQTRLAAERPTNAGRLARSGASTTDDNRVSAQPRSGEGGHGRVVLVQTADSREPAPFDSE